MSTASHMLQSQCLPSRQALCWTPLQAVGFQVLPVSAAVLLSQIHVTGQALADKHEAQLNSVREAAEIQRKQEQHAIEERKNAHIQARLGTMQPPLGHSET